MVPGLSDMINKFLRPKRTTRPAPKKKNVVEARFEPPIEKKLKVLTMNLNKFQDTENVLEYLRTQEYIILLKIRPLREKDVTELKRAVNRVKTHCKATGAEVAAMDDNWIVVVPVNVKIERVSPEELRPSS